MTSPLSRRSALTGALPVLAGLTITATMAMPGLAAGSHPDAALLALGPKLDAALAIWCAALDDHSVAEKAYFAEVPPRPEDDWLSRPRGERPTPLEYVDYVAEKEAQFAVYCAEVDRLTEKHGLTALEQRADHLCDELTERLGAVAEFHATTLAGLRFKARWAEHDEEVRDSLIRDVLAMGEGGP
jgi:hypothetical protein